MKFIEKDCLVSKNLLKENSKQRLYEQIKGTIRLKSWWEVWFLNLNIIKTKEKFETQNQLLFKNLSPSNKIKDDSIKTFVFLK